MVHTPVAKITQNYYLLGINLTSPNHLVTGSDIFTFLASGQTKKFLITNLLRFSLECKSGSDPPFVTLFQSVSSRGIMNSPFLLDLVINNNIFSVYFCIDFFGTELLYYTVSKVKN